MKGALASRASRRAISVFPTPVGPIMMMFFGMTSSRRSRADCGAASGCAARWPRPVWRRPARRCTGRARRRCRAASSRLSWQRPRCESGRWCRCICRLRSHRFLARSARRGERGVASAAPRPRPARRARRCRWPATPVVRLDHVAGAGDDQQSGSASATTSSASSRRRARSVRQSLASSTAAREQVPSEVLELAFESLKQGEGVGGGAGEPGDHLAVVQPAELLAGGGFRTCCRASPGRRRRWRPSRRGARKPQWSIGSSLAIC